MERVYLTGASGLKLAADVAGDPDGQPVVMLHGGGQTRHSWGELTRTLASNGYYAMTVDMRGHGESDGCPEGDYTLDRFAEDVHGILSGLKQPPVLVGASLGGICSLVAAGAAAVTAVAEVRTEIHVDGQPLTLERGVDHEIPVAASTDLEVPGVVRFTVHAGAEAQVHADLFRRFEDRALDVMLVGIRTPDLETRCAGHAVTQRLHAARLPQRQLARPGGDPDHGLSTVSRNVVAASTPYRRAKARSPLTGTCAKRWASAADAVVRFGRSQLGALGGAVGVEHEDVVAVGQPGGALGAAGAAPPTCAGAGSGGEDPVEELHTGHHADGV